MFLGNSEVDLDGERKIYNTSVKESGYVALGSNDMYGHIL